MVISYEMTTSVRSSIDLELLVHLFLIILHVLMSVSWCQGLTAACDCDTPGTFLLTFLYCNTSPVVCRGWDVEVSCVRS